jgi:NAD-dependent SIR2 family protein deacetylase
MHVADAHPQSSIDELAGFLDRNHRLFVLTGAGCSTESGIPDYRDGQGKWKHRQPVQFQDFVRKHSVRQRYWVRSLVGWQRFIQAKPNAAHAALAQLEQAGYIHQLVTQNVDGLHQQAGSRRVIDLHGRLERVECLNCRKHLHRSEFQHMLQTLNPEFRSYTALTAPDGDAQLDDIDFGSFTVPDCDHCGGTLKPGVVFFGESVPRPRVERANTRLDEANGVLVVGSSLMVFSGFRFCRKALEQNKPIAAINLGQTRADPDLALKIVGHCGAVLPALVEYLDLQ